MAWMCVHKRVWRVVILAVFITAVAGPWVFDRVSVPAEYACAYRLEGDFCGIPMSGLWILAAFGGELIHIVTGLAAGSPPPVEWGGEILFILGVVLVLLPFFSTLVLVLRGERPSRPVFLLGAWGLAACLVGWLVHSLPYGPLRGLWGIWLYIALALLALTLEALALLYKPKPGL